MSEQISFIGKELFSDKEIAEMERQANMLMDYAKKKRNWENAFQKWSDNHGMQEDCVESWGACGYGSMCDWCEDNSYGRPCVRALNAMCREKGMTIDYDNTDFESVWGNYGQCHANGCRRWLIACQSEVQCEVEDLYGEGNKSEICR